MSLHFKAAPQQRHVRQMYVWLILSCGAFILVGGSMWWQTSLKQHDIDVLSANNNALQEEIASFDQLIQQKKDATLFKKDLQNKQGAINKLCRLGEQAPVNILDELVELIPSHVFISGLDLDQKRLVLTGSASKVTDITNFLHALEEAHYFINPKLKQLGTKQGMKSQEDGLVPFMIVAGRKN